MGLFEGFGLLDEQFEACTKMDLVTDSSSDGSFGVLEHYQPGARIMAMLEKTNSSEITIAEAQGLREQYTVVVPTGVNLKKDDVIRRDSDGLTFRMTSNTRDGQAPPTSTVQIAKATCERWDIPPDMLIGGGAP